MDLLFNGHFIELMAINMKINDLTHKTIIFKKRKVIDYFNRNLIINGLLMEFNGFCVQ